jgi:hypothetical protein
MLHEITISSMGELEDSHTERDNKAEWNSLYDSRKQKKLHSGLGDDT